MSSSSSLQLVTLKLRRAALFVCTERRRGFVLTGKEDIEYLLADWANIKPEKRKDDKGWRHREWTGNVARIDFNNWKSANLG